MAKKWYLSRTLWVNALAIVGILVFGKELSAEQVATALGVINLVLRLITKEAIVW